MKKSLLIVIVLIYQLPSYCQTAVSTQFDTFINKSSIEWAAYANDTVRFINPNLSNLLIEKTKQKQIVSAYPIVLGTSDANNISYFTKDDFEKTSYVLVLPAYDSTGYIPPPQKSNSKVDSLTNGLLYITQIFYVENGILKSYIPFVSPKLSIYTDQEIFLGTSDYFSTCIHFMYNYRSSPVDSVIYLSTTIKTIKADSTLKTDILKQLYGRNLIESLWASTLKNNYTIVDLRSGKEFSTQEVKEFSVAKPIIRSAFNGEATLNQNYSEPSDPSVFKEIEIVQKWYYNSSKNIVESIIPEVTLYAIPEENTSLQPMIKIVFK